MQENIVYFSRKMETITKNKMKNIVTEIKNIFKSFISKLNIAKDIISDLDNKSVKIIPTEVQI